MPPITSADIFDEIAALLLAATLAGLFALRLRQPLIISFIAVGLLAGPSSLNWIRSVAQIHTMAEMGLALLLFVVGLKLDVHLIRSMGRVALAAGLGQVALTSIGGYLIAQAFGMNAATSFYVAMALTFSSTIIIVKLLSDNREAESLHGRLALGILIVQDVVVVLVMILVSALSGGKSVHAAQQVALVVVKGLGLLVVVWLAASVVLPRALPLLAKSTELLVLFGIMWALGLANLGEELGFSKEIGAFLAGVSLASTPFREAIGIKLISLRDFLLVFFFIELGSRLDFSLLGSRAWSAIPLSLFVLIAKPVIVMAIARAVGYRKRTTFLTGITLGQISEFSLILVALGVKLGHIGNEAVGVVTLVALGTIAASTYMIQYSGNLYDRLAPYLGAFGCKAPCREDAQREMERLSDAADTLMFGLGGYGTGIAEQLDARGRRLLGVDFDPQAVLRWKELGWDAIFGDARDGETVEALHLDRVKWVISSIRDNSVNASLLRSLRRVGYAGCTAIAAYDQAAAKMFSESATDLVLIPFADAAVQAADLVFSKEEELARRAMDRTIEAMSDHYIICGYGRMGQQIAKDLRADNLPIVVVESNPEQLPKLERENIPHVVGEASDDSVLQRAGVERARGLVSVYPTDAENVFIVLTARVLNPKLFIVARSILEENEDKLRRAGADRVMSPYILGGRQMAAAVTKPEIMEFVDLVLHARHFDTIVSHTTVSERSPYIGKSLEEIGLWQNCGVTVLAVRREGEIHANPCPTYVLQANDEVICMGTQAQIDSVERFLKGEQG